MILTSTILALDEKEIQAATVPPITFAVTGLLVIAIILLGIDLVRRIRRAQFREEIQQDLAAEIAERDAKLAASGGADDESTAVGSSDNDFESNAEPSEGTTDSESNT